MNRLFPGMVVVRPMLRQGVAFFCGLLLVGCSISPKQYNDIVYGIDRAMIEDRILPRSDCEWYIEAIKPAGEPIKSMDILEIEANSGKVVLRANEHGRILFPVRADWRKENPSIRLLSDTVADFDTSPRAFTFFRVGDDPIFDVNNPLENAVYESSGFIVYHPEDQLEEAKLSEAELLREQEFISRILGIELPATSVNLVDGEDSENARDASTGPLIEEESPQVTIQPHPKQPPFIWSYPLGWQNKPWWKHFNVHEWTEVYLLTEKEIQLTHKADLTGRNRFFADGLAEYVAIHYLKGVPSPRFRQYVLRKLLRYGIERVDFARFFRTPIRRSWGIPPFVFRSAWNKPARLSEREMEALKAAGYGELARHGLFRASVIDSIESAGYAVAFHFWERLAREHGRDLPRRFIEALTEADPEGRDFEGCLKILEGLTGERRLKEWIVNAALADTLAFFETLPVAPSERSVERSSVESMNWRRIHDTMQQTNNR